MLENQESERLTYRLMKPTDFEDWLPLFDAENIAIFLGLDAKLTPTQLCEIWFSKGVHRLENDLGGLNVLVDKKLNKMVGQCGLLVQDVEGVEMLEIGYSVLPEYWGRGYASEAAIKCRDYAFENNFRETIISMVHKDNISSEKVALKNGMKLERFIPDFKGSPFNIFNIEKKTWEEL